MPREAVRTMFGHPMARLAAVVLVTGAIGFGDAAYQTGNIAGAAMGLEAVFGLSTRLSALVVGMAAIILLEIGVDGFGFSDRQQRQ